MKFLLHILGCSHAEFVCLYNSSAIQRSTAETGKRLHRYSSLWEVQALSFTMLGEAFSRAGSSLPVDIWQSTIEVWMPLCICLCRYKSAVMSICPCVCFVVKVLRKVIDVIASKSVPREDSVLSR